MTRGERRAKTRAKVKTRSKRSKSRGNMTPINADKFPGKFKKQKEGFTHPGASLKKEKQAANRASRRRRHQAAKQGLEEKPEGKNSVKWDHW